MSLNYGHSLKGYQWLRGDKVIMSYLFKDRIIDLWDDVTEKELEDFKAYINSDIIAVNYNNHKIIEES